MKLDRLPPDPADYAQFLEEAAKEAAKRLPERMAQRDAGLRLQELIVADHEASQ